MNKDINWAPLALINGFGFIIFGIIGDILRSPGEGSRLGINIVGGLILFYVAILLNRQVKLQDQLTRIEEKIDK